MRCGDGRDNQPLEDDRIVLRLWRAPMDSNGPGLGAAFELSSGDRAEQPPTISVWEEHCCSAAQAVELVSGKPPHNIAGRLVVANVREIAERIPDNKGIALDVIWRNLRVGADDALDQRPGAFGHSGITGLNRPPGMDKTTFKNLREELGRIAKWSLINLSHGS